MKLFGCQIPGEMKGFLFSCFRYKEITGFLGGREKTFVRGWPRGGSPVHQKSSRASEERLCSRDRNSLMYSGGAKIEAEQKVDQFSLGQNTGVIIFVRGLKSSPWICFFKHKKKVSALYPG